jgi:hypothetical protein
MKKLFLPIITLWLCAIPLVQAGTIYRFTDQNGVITMSKSLPPYAAQQGYEILNDKSLRLIKTVPPALTPEQIIEKERLLAEKQEAEKQAKLAVEEKKQRDYQQAIADQTLLASYASEQDLLDSKQAEIAFRQTELDKTIKHREEKQNELHSLQSEAAQLELSGKPISVNMNKRLIATQEEIANDSQIIERLTTEIQQLDVQYDEDLKRLQFLFEQKKN